MMKWCLFASIALMPIVACAQDITGPVAQVTEPIGSGIFPDSFKKPTDGSDDAPSIQRAMAALCKRPGNAGAGGTVFLKPHVYEIGSNVTVPCALNMVGSGWEEQMTLGGGTWLHIVSSLGVSHSAFTLETTFARASQFSNFAISEDMPLPSKVPNTAWVPTAYKAVFGIKGVGAAVFFHHILLDGVYEGIAAEGAGRIELDGMYADSFHYLIRIDGSEDVDRIRNIHIWPYWTNATVSGSSQKMSMSQEQRENVAAYKIKNTNGIILGRADTPFLDDVFGIGLHSTIVFTNTGEDNTGDPTKVHIGKLSCDKSQYCLFIDGSAKHTSAIIDQIDWQGEDPMHTGMPNADGAAVKVEGGALLQIGAVHAEFIGNSIFSMENKSICSEIITQSIWGNFLFSVSNSSVVNMVSCEVGHHILKASFYDGTKNSEADTPKMVNGEGHFLLGMSSEQNWHK
mgnify:CR=1 FL=1